MVYSIRSTKVALFQYNTLHAQTNHSLSQWLIALNFMHKIDRQSFTCRIVFVVFF